MHKTDTENKCASDNRISLKTDPFQMTLSCHGLKLNRKKTRTLQINVGLLCNQNCRHCHLNAGPGKKEARGNFLVERPQFFREIFPVDLGAVADKKRILADPAGQGFR